MRSDERLEIALQPDRERPLLEQRARRGQREGAAARRDHDASSSAATARASSCSSARKAASPFSRKSSATVRPGPLLDPAVEVLEAVAEPPRQPPADGGLARAHEADQHHAGRPLRHGRRPARARRRSSGRRRPRTRRARSRSAPRAPRAATESAIAMRWSSSESTRAPESGAPPSTTSPSGRSRTRAPSAVSPRASAAMRSVSLCAQLGGAGHLERRPCEGSRHRERRHLVDQRRHERGVDARARARTSAPRSCPPAPARGRRGGLRRPAHRAQHLEEGGARGRQQHALEPQLGVGQHERRHHQEGGARGVAGHVDVGARGAACRPRRSRRGRRARPSRRRPAACARCGRGSASARARSCGPRPKGRRAAAPSSPARSPPGARASSRAGGPPVIVSGAWPSVVSSVAPIARSGAATRSSGRRRSESSPVSVARKGRPASGPASIRIVEPELPASSTASGARQPRSPPWITTSEPSRASVTPRPRRQASVEAQSAADEKLRTRVSPSARAPRIAARCEMDLSPGRVKVPPHGPRRLDLHRGGDRSTVPGGGRSVPGRP